MSGSIQNKKTPSWSDTQNISNKSSSSNNNSVCEGFSCVSCTLNSNQSPKKRKITDFIQISSQLPKQGAFSGLQNNSNNNHIDLTTPPAFNTRSALKRSQSDNASQSSSENQNNGKTGTPSKSSSDNSPNKSNNSNNTKMDMKNLIDLIHEDHTASKKQTSHGATNEKGLLCPVCSKVVPTATNEASLNLHIDECLSMKLLEEENTVPKNQPGPSKVETLPPMNAIHLNEEFMQQWNKSLIQPVKKPVRQDYIVHHDDDSDEHSWDEEESYHSQYHEEEDEEQLGKVRCPYHDCGAYIATEEFGKHVLQNHKGGYQKHLCPLCAPTTGYSVHKGTNLFRHVQQFHAFFLNASPETTTNKPQSKPQPKPQNIEFVEEILMKDLDSECCICFEQFETGNTVARLPCLCIFHKTCVVRWFEKEKRCPVHEEIPQS